MRMPIMILAYERILVVPARATNLLFFHSFFFLFFSYFSVDPIHYAAKVREGAALLR